MKKPSHFDKNMPVLEGVLTDESEPTARDARDTTTEMEHVEFDTIASASLTHAPRGERPLFGSQEFFRRAADELYVSTTHGLELAGAVYAQPAAERTYLLGLTRKSTGRPGLVAIQPGWGALLWHTHPGLRGSLAAFSSQDVECARQANKPLLVIGFGGLSPDVISTLTLPLGVRGLLLSAGMKGVLAMEKLGHLRLGLLRLGVAARVCYPSGKIQPVLRAGAPPWRQAYEDMSYSIDKTVGMVERRGQEVVRKIVKRALK